LELEQRELKKTSAIYDPSFQRKWLDAFGTSSLCIFTFVSEANRR